MSWVPGGTGEFPEIFNFLALWLLCSSCDPVAGVPGERVTGRKTQCSSVQSLSRVRLFATPRIAARRASLSITNSRSSLKLTSIESVIVDYLNVIISP